MNASVIFLSHNQTARTHDQRISSTRLSHTTVKSLQLLLFQKISKSMQGHQQLSHRTFVSVTHKGTCALLNNRGERIVYFELEAEKGEPFRANMQDGV